MRPPAELVDRLRERVTVLGTREPAELKAMLRAELQELIASRLDPEHPVDALLGEADFITVHTPLTDETRGMINRETIAKMKDGARIVNAARGALIDEDALLLQLLPDDGKPAPG